MTSQSSDTTAQPALPESSGGLANLLHLILGPILPCRKLRSLVGLYLLFDAFAIWLITTGQVAMAADLIVLTRFIAYVATRALRLDRKPGSLPPLTMVLDASLYLFTLAAVGVAGAMPNAFPSLTAFPAPEGLRAQYAGNIDSAIGYVTLHWETFFQALTRGLLWLLSTLEAILSNTPWPVFFAVIGVIAWRRGGLSLLAISWVGLGYLGLFGYWVEAMQTLALVIASLVVCIVVGVPLGIFIAKSRVASVIASPILDLMQTMPSFVYLLPAVAFFSIGKPPALIATVIFALPPLVRLTCLGIQQVPLYVREAMQAHGATPFQTLVKAELPLALPSIRTGINQTIMMCLAMVVIAALIGGGGLGYEVLFALQNVQYGQGALAGLAIVFCAVLFDRLIRNSKNKNQR
jgi:glycine betaine/proline transport system permease protein